MGMTGPRTLAELTTLRVGGPIAGLVAATTREELIDAIKSADREGRPVLVLGGGSNLLAADAPFEGVVVRDTRHEVEVGSRPGIETEAGQRGSDLVAVTASAGTPWDALVEECVDLGLSGLEALSGIPGTVGAAPVQNVGAYGHDVSGTLKSVCAWDREAGEVVTLSVADLRLGYRASIIKASRRRGDQSEALWSPTGRWVVLDATFVLEGSQESAPVLYGELAHRLGVEVGDRASARAVREAVLALRHSKGMVLDPDDHDTWSAGSFFTNPILPAEVATELLPEDAPRFPASEGKVKTSAAWLIGHAGFTKGWAVGMSSGSAPGLLDDGEAEVTPTDRHPRASLSTKHVLALTNRGGANAADIVELARAVRDGVREVFGVELVPEPVTVGLEI